MKTSYAWHSCTPNGKCRMLKSSVIARLFLDKLRLKPKYMPADIQEHIKERWKLVSSRGQCQRGRVKILKMLAEEYAAQFAHIRGYTEKILDTNPGTTIVEIKFVFQVGSSSSQPPETMTITQPNQSIQPTQTSSGCDI